VSQSELDPPELMKLLAIPIRNIGKLSHRIPRINPNIDSALLKGAGSFILMAIDTPKYS